MAVSQEVHVPYVDYDLDLNQIQQQGVNSADPLKALSAYRVRSEQHGEAP